MNMQRSETENNSIIEKYWPKKIYIAGPDVFRPDAKEIGEYYKSICEKYNFIGLFPLDNESSDPFEIGDINEALIDEADYVVANMNPFRGLGMDDGTAYEIGYARHAGKPVYGYMDDIRDMRTKIGETDTDGNNVENFGFPNNLMIARRSIIVEGGFEDCIKIVGKVPIIS